MPALRTARALPDIPTVRRRSQALAMLDAIMSPEWEMRFYSYDASWAPDEEMASMRTGSGDAYSIVFSPAGAFIRGFDHESPISPWRDGRLWPGLVDNVPEAFASSLNEPAFSTPDGLLEATVCIWRRTDDPAWQTADIPEPDGAGWLFECLLDPTGAAYHRFAEDYYETSVSAEAVAGIFALPPLTDELVRRLNPDIGLADLAEDLAEIGYPSRA